MPQAGSGWGTWVSSTRPALIGATGMGGYSVTSLLLPRCPAQLRAEEHRPPDTWSSWPAPPWPRTFQSLSSHGRFSACSSLAENLPWLLRLWPRAPEAARLTLHPGSSLWPGFCPGHRIPDRYPREAMRPSPQVRMTELVCGRHGQCTLGTEPSGVPAPW